jgi:hypothetical protein
MSKLEDWKKDKQWKGVDPSHEWTYHILLSITMFIGMPKIIVKIVYNIASHI